MFLKDLYRHSKWMFAGFILFALVQLTINAKRGMVFTPFFHYGMYSAPMKAPVLIKTNLVLVDNDTLRGSDFTPPAWDKIQYTLNRVYASACDTLFYAQQVKRLFEKAGMPAPPVSAFVNNGSMAQRLAVYKKWLAKQLHKGDAQISIIACNYRYRYTRLVLHSIDSIPQSNIICP